MLGGEGRSVAKNDADGRLPVDLRHDEGVQGDAARGGVAHGDTRLTNGGVEDVKSTPIAAEVHVSFQCGLL